MYSQRVTIFNSTLFISVRHAEVVRHVMTLQCFLGFIAENIGSRKSSLIRTPFHKVSSRHSFTSSIADPTSISCRTIKPSLKSSSSPAQDGFAHAFILYRTHGPTKDERAKNLQSCLSHSLKELRPTMKTKPHVTIQRRPFHSSPIRRNEETKKSPKLLPVTVPSSRRRKARTTGRSRLG